MDGKSVTIVTPAMVERVGQWLTETIVSVNEQTVRPDMHLIGIDHDRVGCAAMMHRLVKSVETDFFVPLADDDILHPNFLERLLEASEGADVVYPYCTVIGRNWNPNGPFDADRLRSGNYIPSTALIRTSTFMELGGYDMVVAEDWSYWIKIISNNKVMRCVPEELWTYRFHNAADGIPQNISNGWQYEWHNWHGTKWSLHD